MSDTEAHRDTCLIQALVAAQDAHRDAKAELRAAYAAYPCTGSATWPPDALGFKDPMTCWQARIARCDNCQRVESAYIAWRDAKHALGRARAAITRRGHQIQKEAKDE